MLVSPNLFFLLLNNISLKILLSIFPLRVFGSSVKKNILSGEANVPNVSFITWRILFSKLFLLNLVDTKMKILLPFKESSPAIAAASVIPGIFNIVLSISAEPIL